MSDWRPIETAPKGVPILVYGGEWAGEVSFSDSDYTRKIWIVVRSGDAYDIVDTGHYSAWVVDPTHWMLLPAPPV
jgi:hypothetical protein